MSELRTGAHGLAVAAVLARLEREHGQARLLAGEEARRAVAFANCWLGVSIENRKWVGRADILRDTPAAVRFISAEPLLGPLDKLDLTGIDWLIAGGESGPNFRPMDLQWMRDLRDACAASDTAFFAKQIASARPGVDPPEDLLIREFPAVSR